MAVGTPQRSRAGGASGRTVKQTSGPSMAAGEWQGDSYMSYVESRIAGLASSGERGSTGDESALPVVAWALVPVAMVALAAVCVLVASVFIVG